MSRLDKVLRGLKETLRDVGIDAVFTDLDLLETEVISPITVLRERLNMCIDDLAKLLKMRVINLQSLEDLRTKPSLDTLLKLKLISRDHGLEITLDELVSESF